MIPVFDGQAHEFFTTQPSFAQILPYCTDISSQNLAKHGRLEYS